MSWLSRLVPIFLVLGIVLSPLRATAATIPVLDAYSALLGSSVRIDNAVRREPSAAPEYVYDAALDGYDGSPNLRATVSGGALRAYDRALEHASRCELRPQGAIYGPSIATRAAEGVTAESSAVARASDAAFSAASRADEFAVGAKHLAGSGGWWAQFAEGTDPNALLQQALRSPGARFLPNDATSFRVVTDLGVEIGTKGQTGIRAVVDFNGQVVTWFPVNP